MKLTIEQHYILAEKIHNHNHFTDLVGRQIKIANLSGYRFLRTKSETGKDLAISSLDIISQYFNSGDWIEPFYIDFPELQNLEKEEIIGLLTTALSPSFDIDKEKAKNLTLEQIEWFEKKFNAVNE